MNRIISIVLVLGGSWIDISIVGLRFVGAAGRNSKVIRSITVDGQANRR